LRLRGHVVGRANTTDSFVDRLELSKLSDD
jgi:hypothetical protein